MPGLWRRPRLIHLHRQRVPVSEASPEVGIGAKGNAGMTTVLDKQSADGLVSRLGGRVLDDGWPDALWISPDDPTIWIAVEWKRRGDAWRVGQRDVAQAFAARGIPYVLARGEEAVHLNAERILDWAPTFVPFEFDGRVYAIEDDPRI